MVEELPHVHEVLARFMNQGWWYPPEILYLRGGGRKVRCLGSSWTTELEVAWISEALPPTKKKKNILMARKQNMTADMYDRAEFNL